MKVMATLPSGPACAHGRGGKRLERPRDRGPCAEGRHTVHSSHLERRRADEPDHAVRRPPPGRQRVLRVPDPRSVGVEPRGPASAAAASTAPSRAPGRRPPRSPPAMLAAFDVCLGSSGDMRGRALAAWLVHSRSPWSRGPGTDCRLRRTLTRTAWSTPWRSPSARAPATRPAPPRASRSRKRCLDCTYDLTASRYGTVPAVQLPPAADATFAGRRRRLRSELLAPPVSARHAVRRLLDQRLRARAGGRAPPNPAPAREVDFELVAMQRTARPSSTPSRTPRTAWSRLAPSTLPCSRTPRRARQASSPTHAPDPARRLSAAWRRRSPLRPRVGVEEDDDRSRGPARGPRWRAPPEFTNRVNTLPSYLGRNSHAGAFGHDELCALPPPGSFLCYDGAFVAPGFEQATVDVRATPSSPRRYVLKLRRPWRWPAPRRARTGSPCTTSSATSRATK